MNSTLGAIPAGLWSYDSNDRLSTDTYDDAGNTVWSAGIENKYDCENHLVQHGEIKVVYDGDGNRVAKTVGGVTTAYLVDTNNPTGYAQVIDELQGGQVTRSYTYGLDLISQTQPINGAWTTSYYGYDGHGSVRFLTDASAAVTDTYDYDAFGNLINQTGSTPNNYLYSGEQFDPDLGLYYNRARYLDVRTGRFWGVDSWGGESHSPMSLHKYLYVGANPINSLDPSGNMNLAEQTMVMGISTTIAAMAISAMALTGGQAGRQKYPDAILISLGANVGAEGFAGGIGLDVYIGLHGQGIWVSPVLQFGLSPLTMFSRYSMVQGNFMGGVTAGFAWAETPSDLNGFSVSATWPKRAFNTIVRMFPGGAEPFATLGYLARINGEGNVQSRDWVATFGYSPESKASFFQIGIRSNSFSAMGSWDTGFFRVLSPEDLGPFGNVYDLIRSLAERVSSPESLLEVIQ
jgi:RHS repeat-associated protein